MSNQFIWNYHGILIGHIETMMMEFGVGIHERRMCFRALGEFLRSYCEISSKLFVTTKLMIT